MTSKKNMILQFRIAELQTFLEAFGERNLKLRKKELQKKALAILTQKRGKAVGQKITSLYNSMNSSRQSASTPYRLRKNEYVGKRHISGRNYHFDDSPLYDDDFYAADKYSDAHFPDYDTSGPLDLSEHASYVSKFQHLDTEAIKKIKFPDLPFYEHVLDLMLVTPLVPISDTPIDNLFEFKTTFSLSSEAFRCLFRCDDRNTKYEAMFRICLFDEKLEIEDSIPQKLYLTVNNKFCSCVPDNYSSKNDSSGKRAAVPIKITPLIDRNLLVHQVMVHWSVSYNTMFAATVQLVKKRGTDALIKHLVDKGEQDPSVSKRFIYNNLNDEDNEIAATSLKMSLICPLGKMLMTYPSRGTTCNHLQCFDGALYIKMNEIKCTWQCPVCHQTCLYQNLFIDGYFMDILRSEKFKPDMRDVQLSADGSWESVAPETKKRPKTSSPMKVPEKQVRIDEAYERILPDSEHNLTEASFGDDLREIFTSFINCSETRSHYPEFSIYGDSFFESAESRSSSVPPSIQPPPTYSPVPESSLAQKKVILVDLTTDSETDDDIKSTSSSSNDSSIDFYVDHVENNSVSNVNSDILCPNPLKKIFNPCSPPVYDIDSD